LQRFRGHDGSVWPVAFSPDGKTLVTAGKDKTIRFWDLGTGKETRRLSGHQDGIPMVVFAPDGKTLASVSHDGTVRLWDLATQKERFPHEGHMGGLLAAACSPDGKLIATAGKDNTVRLWDAGTAKELRQITSHADWVTAVAFRPDGKMLASGDRGGNIHLTELATGKLFGQIGVGSAGGIRSLSFAPDSKTLALSNDKEVALWDVTALLNTNPRRPEVPAGNITAVHFFPNGKLLAAACGNNEVLVWDLATEEIRVRFQVSGPGAALRLAFSSDGRMLATATGQGTGVGLWEVVTGKQRRLLEHAGGAGCVAFSADGRLLVSAGSDGSLRLWDVQTGQEIRQARGHRGAVNALAVVPGGNLLVSASEDCTALVWDLTVLAKRRLAPEVELSRAQLEACWQDLAAADAGKAWLAVGTLTAAAKQAVPFLHEMLQKNPPHDDSKRIDQLLAALDDEQFSVREQATAELLKLGKSAEPALRKALAGGASGEVRKRGELILEKLREGNAVPAVLRLSRAVEALERIGTPEARKALEELGHGAPGALSEETRQAVERLNNKPTP
jgi:WD40 repeat protein